MKAEDLTKVIKKHEDSLTRKFNSAINQALNSITEETGLDIDGIDMRIEEGTAMGDTSKKYVLAEVYIHVSLPHHF